MPDITISGTRYTYIDEGSGPLIVFGHGLLASKEMFAAQIDALKDRYRCVSIDWPGHGASSFPTSGWDFYDMADTTVALVRELGERQAVFAGLSQGGMVFMRLALRNPDMVKALILLDTSAGPENPESLPQYEQLVEGMRHGTDEERRELIKVVASILYGQTWLNSSPEGVAHETELMLSHDREGQYLSARAVFDRDDVTGQISQIQAPTLVIVGEEDVATPVELAQVLAEEIPNAELVRIPRAGHHTPIENPQDTTSAIETFLARVAAPAAT